MITTVFHPPLPSPPPPHHPFVSRKLFGKGSSVPVYCAKHIPSTCLLVALQQGGRRFLEVAGSGAVLPVDAPLNGSDSLTASNPSSSASMSALRNDDGSQQGATTSATASPMRTSSSGAGASHPGGSAGSSLPERASRLALSPLKPPDKTSRPARSTGVSPAGGVPAPVLPDLVGGGAAGISGAAALGPQMPPALPFALPGTGIPMSISNGSGGDPSGQLLQQQWMLQQQMQQMQQLQQLQQMQQQLGLLALQQPGSGTAGVPGTSPPDGAALLDGTNVEASSAAASLASMGFSLPVQSTAWPLNPNDPSAAMGLSGQFGLMGMGGMPGVGLGGGLDYTALLNEMNRLQEQAQTAEKEAREAKEEAREAREREKAEALKRRQAEAERDLWKKKVRWR